MMKPEEYAKLQPFIQKEVEAALAKEREKGQFQNFKASRHIHNGDDMEMISQNNIIPGRSALGSITMASNRRYKLGLTFNPTQMLFFGLARNLTSGIRVRVDSAACFGETYYFQPETNSTVKPGNIINVVQGGAWLWTEKDPGTAAITFRSRSSEGHLVNVDSNGTDIVARATIPNRATAAIPANSSQLVPMSDAYGYRGTKGYGEGFVYVDVYLASGWAIDATFVVF